MRPARKGPENGRRGHVAADLVGASMRPARKGPENLRGCSESSITYRRFNEAGPQGAGKRPFDQSTFRGVIGFNEAGPQGAGKRGRRPRWRARAGARFNEAGPQGAGKRTLRAILTEYADELQ